MMTWILEGGVLLFGLFCMFLAGNKGLWLGLDRGKQTMIATEKYARENWWCPTRRNRNAVTGVTATFAKLCAARHAGFLRELDLYTDEELRTDPFYRDIIHPGGLGDAAATTFVLPTQDRVLILLKGGQARGPVEPHAVETLRPHIAAAAWPDDP
jgi:hypothetical protein